jgi:hypothetical protein
LKLRPFFGFYGSKWRLAKRYPEPLYADLVEPFAGSAGYALAYPDRAVTLIERDPVVAGIWRYLKAAEPADVLALPDDAQEIPAGPARDLAGFWYAKAPTSPRLTRSAWARNPKYAGSSWWGPRIRERIASQLYAIRHWTIVEGDYTAAPDVTATWFVDPPYQGKAGRAYRHGSKSIDYAALAAWCRSRRGQVIVCEGVDAGWLPFVPIEGAGRGIGSATAGRRRGEAVWSP